MTPLLGWRARDRYLREASAIARERWSCASVAGGRPVGERIDASCVRIHVTDRCRDWYELVRCWWGRVLSSRPHRVEDCPWPISSPDSQRTRAHRETTQ